MVDMRGSAGVPFSIASRNRSPRGTVEVWMAALALVPSILRAALGTLGMLAPRRLADLARGFLSPGSLN